MDVIRDTIETRANELYQAQEKLKNTPLYPHSAAYASEHGRWHSTTLRFRQATPAWRPSSRRSAAITAITGWMPKPSVNDVLEQFGPDRVQYVLANTVRHKEWDGRISRDNKAWASTIPMPEGGSQDPAQRVSGGGPLQSWPDRPVSEAGAAACRRTGKALYPGEAAKGSGSSQALCPGQKERDGALTWRTGNGKSN